MLYSEDVTGRRRYLIIDFQYSLSFKLPHRVSQLLRPATGLGREAQKAFTEDVDSFGGFLNGVYFDIVSDPTPTNEFAPEVCVALRQADAYPSPELTRLIDDTGADESGKELSMREVEQRLAALLDSRQGPPTVLCKSAELAAKAGAILSAWTWTRIWSTLHRLLLRI